MQIDDEVLESHPDGEDEMNCSKHIQHWPVRSTPVPQETLLDRTRGVEEGKDQTTSVFIRETVGNHECH